MTSKLVTERRAFLVALIFFGFIFLLLLKPVFIPLFLAIILTVLFFPTYGFFLRLFKGRAWAASFVTTFLIFLGIVLPLTLITTLVINQAVGFVSQMNVQEFFNTFMSRDFYRNTVEPWMNRIEMRSNLTLDLPALVTKVGTEAVKAVYEFSPQVLIQTFSFVFGFFIMHFSVFFLFIEGKNLMKTVMNLSPIRDAYESRLFQEFKKMIEATIYGSLLTSMVQGALAGIGFWVAHVPAPLVFGTLTFFMSLVPIVGSAVVWIPVALWLFIQGNTGYAVFLAIYGALVISGVDNILKPLLMKGRANIHVLLIFFSLLGGIKFLGPIGILFGPVVTALFLACIRIYREDFLSQDLTNQR
ncbi:MAG: AI-2E family transporter [Deltaproteobacteria bacterium]|nr:AI-2E family transporter [Deltaproteobacteria bacterium]